MINAEIIQNQNHAEEPMCLSHEPLGSSLLIISQLRAVSSHTLCGHAGYQRCLQNNISQNFPKSLRKNDGDSYNNPCRAAGYINKHTLIYIQPPVLETGS